MTAAHLTAVTLPIHRSTPLDPPAEYQHLREQSPVTPLAFPDGTSGWLITRHDDVRAVLADDRFSSNRENASSPIRRPQFQPQDRAGMLLSMDPPEHTHYRRMLTRYFTVRRMHALAPRIEEIVAEHLDAMGAAGPPSDLVPDFARPIPSLVICELLGVPYADREQFQRWTANLLSIHATEDQIREGIEALRQYTRDLIADKRKSPDDALIGTLIRAGEQDPEANYLTDEELAGISRLLLIAGHETTANMLALGTYTLLCNPGQLPSMLDGANGTARAVEELMRYLTIVHFGTVRVAREDIDFRGQHIRAGQTVMMSLASANRDPNQFDQPDVLNLNREHSQHVAFGHGVHQCLGQQLARVEMQIAFPALFRRFPTLRLAVPAEQVPMRDDMFVYGVHALPVTWDTKAAG
ncbi:cytochrome P450 [Smaragdicoccus niigatensis]|uniref:cytochrome P450 n=1 Tax=Smaragdicoccus niigatensis TaxID=359359 RepID=UPI0003774DD6|nr:cytochrome P450 [Smaragdicoccus niigatensis]